MGSVGEWRRNAAPTLLHPPGMRAQRDRSANHSDPFWGATLLLPPCPRMGTASVPRSVLWDPRWVQPCAPQAKLCSPDPAVPPGAQGSSPGLSPCPQHGELWPRRSSQPPHHAAPYKHQQSTPCRPNPLQSPRGALKLQHAAPGALRAGNSSPVQVTKPAAPPGSIAPSLRAHCCTTPCPWQPHAPSHPAPPTPPPPSHPPIPHSNGSKHSAEMQKEEKMIPTHGKKLLLEQLRAGCRPASPQRGRVWGGEKPGGGSEGPGPPQHALLAALQPHPRKQTGGGRHCSAGKQKGVRAVPTWVGAA